jgi:hypothetical protein
MALVVDQIPESLLPAISMRAHAPLSAIDILMVVLIFFVDELALSRVFFRLGLRERPYWVKRPTRQCSVISGLLWNRTGTTDDPAPTDV